MRKTLTFGHVSGIPLRLQLNWFLTAALVTWSLSVGYLPQTIPNRTTEIYWLYGSITAFFFFASVLAHELGHAVVSVSEGVQVRSITLFIFGGVAHIAREPSTPRAEFRIVAAGPFASLFLAASFYFAAFLTAGLHPDSSSLSLYLAQVNLILAVFNLIPGFPLDGGRILRSILWSIKGDFAIATRWARNIGVLLAAGAIAGGIMMMFFGYVLNGLWIAFIGWYLSRTAKESYNQSMKYMPWSGNRVRLNPSNLASIIMRSEPPNFRAAVIRVETVRHSTAPGLPSGFASEAFAADEENLQSTTR